jgi:hypothetical protein
MMLQKVKDLNRRGEKDVMGFIHSKLRNSLGRDTVEKLVYVKTNNL